MTNNFKYVLLFLVILISACNSNIKTKQSTSVFPKGEILNSENFSGTIWLQMMGANDSTLPARFGNVTFAPKARTNWHLHPGGQVFFITEGKGFYQERGKQPGLCKKAKWLKSLEIRNIGMDQHPIANLPTSPSVLTRMKEVPFG